MAERIALVAVAQIRMRVDLHHAEVADAGVEVAADDAPVTVCSPPSTTGIFPSAKMRATEAAIAAMTFSAFGLQSMAGQV